MRKLKYSVLGIAALVSLGPVGMMTSAHAVSLSPKDAVTNHKTNQSPILKVTHRTYDTNGYSCSTWREKCRKTWRNDSYSYYNCLVYRGCAGSAGYSRPTAPRKVYRPAPRYYDPAPRPVYEGSLKDTTPYNGQYNGNGSDYNYNNGYNGNGYNGAYNGYNGYQTPIDPKVPAHSEDNNCRARHAECVQNWGTSYRNYFGCMRYYQCRPRFYPKIYRDQAVDEPDYDDGAVVNGYEAPRPRYW